MTVSRIEQVLAQDGLTWVKSGNLLEDGWWAMVRLDTTRGMWVRAQRATLHGRPVELFLVDAAHTSIRSADPRPPALVEGAEIEWEETTVRTAAELGDDMFPGWRP